MVESIILLYEYRRWIAVVILVRGNIPIMLWMVGQGAGFSDALCKFLGAK